MQYMHAQVGAGSPRVSAGSRSVTSSCYLSETLPVWFCYPRRAILFLLEGTGNRTGQHHTPRVTGAGGVATPRACGVWWSNHIGQVTRAYVRFNRHGESGSARGGPSPLLTGASARDKIIVCLCHTQILEART